MALGRGLGLGRGEFGPGRSGIAEVVYEDPRRPLVHVGRRVVRRSLGQGADRFPGFGGPAVRPRLPVAQRRLVRGATAQIAAGRPGQERGVSH
jgi:hypothetical protein